MIKRITGALFVWAVCQSAAAAQTDAAISPNVANKQCQQSFQLKVITHTDFSFQGNQRSRHKLTAYLSTKKLQRVEKGQWWGMQLTQVTQTANGQPVPNDPVYDLPFALLRNSQGHIVDYYFPGKITPDQQNILKGLTQYFQFPDVISEAELRRNEFDVNGELQAVYRYDAQPSNLHKNLHKQPGKKFKSSEPVLQKQKLKYLAVPENGQEALSELKVKESTQSIVAAPCLLEETRGRETLQARGINGAFNMLTGQTFSVVKVDKLAESLLWSLPADAENWRIGENARPLTETEREALGRKFAAMLKQLDITEYSGGELSELLLQYDAVIDVIQPLLLEQQFSDAQQKRLFNALGLLDSENGNALLVNLINNAGLDETNRFRAMRAISNGTSALTPALTEQLLILLDDEDFVATEALHSAAIMSLGAIVQRREQNHHSEALLDAISQKLTPSLPDAKRAALVASLGNSASEQIIDEVIAYAGDTAQRVRANVARSLGQIGGEQAYEVLGGMLYSESGQNAQQAVLGAIAQFELDTEEVNRVSQLAKTSKSERTRGLAITALSNQKHHKAQVQVALQSIMKQETSRQNFKKAAKALVQLNSSNQNN